MLSSIWILSVAGLLFADLRTGALQQNESITHRCYSCSGNENLCDNTTLQALDCPADHAFCATSAVAPNFTSSLNCAAGSNSSCSLTHIADKGFEFVCVCAGSICNKPFSAQLQKQLLAFSSSNYSAANSTDYTKAFYRFANITEGEIQKVEFVEITERIYVNTTELPIHPVSFVTPFRSTTMSHLVGMKEPHAEALKQEATAPSDDDEDEGEGSGSYEDSRSHRPASAPAAPSSYLPANENNSPSLTANFLIYIPLILYLTK